jgi:hypothetical protein
MYGTKGRAVHANRKSFSDIVDEPQRKRREAMNELQFVVSSLLLVYICLNYLYAYDFESTAMA